jgi:antitoxin (DNA-binding transcriptional repressor) of toxin-antitoxin stability system
MQIISATELARNTRSVLDKVVNRGETVTIERNNSAIALITPALRHMSVAEALVGLSLRPSAALTSAQAKNWIKDSKESFNEAIDDPWA